MIKISIIKKILVVGFYGYIEKCQQKFWLKK